MKIYIDADACPAKDIVIQEAAATNIIVVIVRSFAHFSLQDDDKHVETIYVDTGADAVDYKIMQLAQPKDMIITQDYGLAALGLAKKCVVLHHNGFIYSHHNIEQLLSTRHQQGKQRRGGMRTKGPKAYTAHDRDKFRRLLRSIIISE